MCQGFSLQTEAEWLGGFGSTMLNLETGELWISEGAYRIAGLRRLSAVSAKSDLELLPDLVHPDDVEAVQARRAIAVEDGAGTTESFGSFDPMGPCVMFVQRGNPLMPPTGTRRSF